MDPASRADRTFLFTDIAGSTRHWERNFAAMSTALARHDQLMNSIIEDQHGVVFKTVGDAFCAAFIQPDDALNAAVAIQQAMAMEMFDQIGQLQVRLAVHTGPAEVRAEDYFGPTMNRVARLLGIGHGGQLLISRSTADLLASSLPGGIALHDLGGHRLKDLDRPEHVFQVDIAGLANDFPPLMSLDARPNNLPTQTDSLIGRDEEVQSLVDLLLRPEVREVTICGPGGIGKTRLAVAVGAELSDEFPDGVWFVDLGPLVDPALVLPTIARVLGLPEVTGQPVGETLAATLRDDTALLVLDTMEHVVQSATDVARLVAVCPGVKLLATSRVPLRIRGEHEVRVRPLALPPTGDIVAITSNPAVQLFVARMRTISPDLALNDVTGTLVAAICIRLEGLPLALELAAARTRTMSLTTLLTRLERRIPLLTTGNRDAPYRQQTIRATIDWSYDLLSDSHQTLFRHLAIVPSGCTMTNATAIWPATVGETVPDELAVLDAIDVLVSGSLLQPAALDDDEPRFRMLDLIREYGMQRLETAGEARAAYHQLADWCWRLAEEADQARHGPDQSDWLDRLEAEQNSIRASLLWLIEQKDTETVLRLAHALTWFWQARGYLVEGLDWCERALALRDSATPEAISLGLVAGGTLAFERGESAQAVAWYTESLEIQRTLGNPLAMVAPLNNLANMLRIHGAHDEAAKLFEEALGIVRELGDQARLAVILNNLGSLEVVTGQPIRARARCEEALAIRRQIGDHLGMISSLRSLSQLALTEKQFDQASAYIQEALEIAEMQQPDSLRGDFLSDLGNIASAQGDYARAQELHQDALIIHQTQGSGMGTAADLQNLGMVMIRQREIPAGAALLLQALDMWLLQNDLTGQLGCLLGMAEIATAADLARDAARLLGGFTSMKDHAGLALAFEEEVDLQGVMSATRADLGDVTFDRQFALGANLELLELVALARDIGKKVEAADDSAEGER